MTNASQGKPPTKVWWLVLTIGLAVGIGLPLSANVAASWQDQDGP
jgi:hypothetical protein